MAEPTLTFTLTGADAERLARLVISGDYATAEDAVSEALAALEEAADPTLEAWLREVVAGRFDAHAADPSQAVSLGDARRRLLDAG